MRGFLNSTEKRYGMAALVALLVCFLLLPAYIVWDISQTVGKLATQVLDMERQHIIERGEQQRFNKTIKARMDSIADENKWVREQESSRAYQRTNVVQATITFYTCGAESTGKSPGHPAYCLTASGHRLTPADAMVKVAADNRYYKFGQRILIEGIGPAVVVDTGGDIVGPNRFDVYVGEDVNKAIKLGRQVRKVIIIN